MKMKTPRASLKRAAASIALALCAAGASASTCPVTYVFVGATAFVSGSSIPVGAQVTGTYTFDYANTKANGNASSNFTFGPIGSGTAGWAVGNATLNANPPNPTGYAFSSTAQVGGFSYASSVADAQAKSFYSSWANQYGEQNYATFDAYEAQTDRNGRLTSSELYVSNASGSGAGTPAFGPRGLPQLTSDTEAYGVIETDDVYIGFNISSLTPVVGPGQCVR